MRIGEGVGDGGFEGIGKLMRIFNGPLPRHGHGEVDDAVAA